jgi:hypothetical protein
MVTKAKARKILHDGKIRGKALTTRQKGFFGAIAGGSSNKTAAKKRRKR